MHQLTQKNRTLIRLKTGEWLVMPETLHWSPPITRLGARIWDLKADGHNIIERRVEGTAYSEYKLIPPVVPKLPPAFEPTPAEAAQRLF